MAQAMESDMVIAIYLNRQSAVQFIENKPRSDWGSYKIIEKDIDGP